MKLAQQARSSSARRALDELATLSFKRCNTTANIYKAGSTIHVSLALVIGTCYHAVWPLCAASNISFRWLRPLMIIYEPHQLAPPTVI